MPMLPIDLQQSTMNSAINSIAASSGNGSQNVSNPAFGLALSTTPVGSTYRGIGSSWFNAEHIASEDFQRNEQAANNALLRDLYAMEQANKFSASEAQKNRDFQERLSSTAYQRAMADLKAAGINPIMAFQNGASGASTPSGSSASSSSSRSSGGYSQRSYNDPLGTVVNGALMLVAGILSQNTQLTVAGLGSVVSHSYDSKGRIKSVTTTRKR